VTDRLTVLGLSAENVRILRIVNLDNLPHEGVITIAGPNDSGKSTILDVILAAVDVTRTDWRVPIRRGEEGAREVVTLQSAQPAGKTVLTITRIWKEGGKSELTVTDAEGVPIKSPQRFLDGLIGAGIGFDPAAFAQQKPAEQVEALLRVLQLPEDPREIDLKRARLYDERTAIGREVKRLEGLHASQKMPDPRTPREEVSLAQLTQDLREAIQARAAWDGDVSALKALDGLIDADRKEILELEGKLAAARLRRTGRAKEWDTLARLHEEKGPRPDTKPAEDALDQADTVNQAVRAAQAWWESSKAVGHQKASYDELTEEIRALDEHKRELLGSAHFPIPGLGFAQIGKDWTVTWNDFPLQDCATSVKLRVGLAMAMSDNPLLRVVLLREAAFFDEENRALLRTWAAEHGVQVWEELVGEHQGAFIIEDGMIVRTPPKGGQ
jgi:hypothetical protein